MRLILLLSLATFINVCNASDIFNIHARPLTNEPNNVEDEDRYSWSYWLSKYILYLSILIHL